MAGQGSPKQAARLAVRVLASKTVTLIVRVSAPLVTHQSFALGQGRSERAASIARELQITLVAAGHYATEVFGAQRLVDELRMKFAGLDVEYIDVPTPI